MSDDRMYNLLEIRRRFHERGEHLKLDDLEFLLDLAFSLDLTASELAADVRQLLIGSITEMSPLRSVPPNPSRPAPLGPMVRVDVYECEDDKLRVEVERTPGTDDVMDRKVGAYLQDEVAAPNCPNCEHEMAHVSRKLRRTT